MKRASTIFIAAVLLFAGVLAGPVADSAESKGKPAAAKKAKGKKAKKNQRQASPTCPGRVICSQMPGRE